MLDKNGRAKTLHEEVELINREMESERLFLRPLTFNELIYISNNELSKVQTQIEEEALLDQVKIAISKKICKMKDVSEDVHVWFTYWLIINKENNKGIGFIGLKGTPDENRYSEVGYSISSNYRKRGLMTEALSLLLNWASKFPACKGITATRVLKTNTGSNNVLNNCCFAMIASTDECNNYIHIFKEE